MNGYQQNRGNSHRRPATGPPQRHAGLPPLKAAHAMGESGKIKFYDPVRGFGFIARPDGPDVFIHSSIVTKYGVNDRLLEPDAPVRFSIAADNTRGAKADAIALA